MTFEFKTASRISEVAEKNAKKIQQIETNTRRHAEALSVAGVTLQRMEKELNKIGLTIVQASTSKTGHGEDWTETTKLKVSIRCAAKNSKFKFVKFAGYKANGCGRNEKRLDDKAAKIEEAVKGIHKVQVNQYSLEYGRRENDLAENKTVAIEFWC